MFKTCPICGKEFVAWHASKIFCSSTCWKKHKSEHQRQRYKQICEKVREQHRQYYKQNRESILEKQKKRRFGPPPPPLKVASCHFCGKTYKQKFHNDHFCSDDCRLEFYGHNSIFTNFFARLADAID